MRINIFLARNYLKFQQILLLILNYILYCKLEI